MKVCKDSCAVVEAVALVRINHLEGILTGITLVTILVTIRTQESVVEAVAIAIISIPTLALSTVCSRTSTVSSNSQT